MQNFVRTFWTEEDGQGMAEYGLILGLIAVFCVGAMTLMGQGINTALSNVTTELTKAGAGQ